MISRTIRGIEGDRSRLRGYALAIIRRVLERPLARSKDARRDWLAPPPLSMFRHLEPLDLHDRDDFWLFHPKDCKPDLVWPLNVGAIAIDGDDLSIRRTISITARQARGYASRFGPFMVRHDVAGTIGTGELVTAAGLYVWLGGDWVDADAHPRWKGRSAEVATPERGWIAPENERQQPALAAALALRQRYEWAVSLGLEHSPSIPFATDPTGIKDIFRIRDLPPGGDRREALLAWITDHWRQDRVDPDIEVYVRRHLRGATAFAWRGMAGEILPAQYDLDHRDRLIAEREAMRAAGIDRRKRA